MSTIATITRAALVAAVASVCVAGSASAESALIDDGKGDTYLAVPPEGGGAPTYEASEVKTNVDLDDVKVRHTDKRVAVDATYFNLAKASGRQFSVRGLLTTDDGSAWYLVGGAYPTDEGWVENVGVYPAEEPSRGVNSCPEAKVVVDWSDDVVSLSAPRSCFGTPRWVTAHVDASGQSDSTDGFNIYKDNAHNAKANDKGVTDRIRKG